MLACQLLLGALDLAQGRYRLGVLAWTVCTANLLSMGGGL